MNRDVTQSEKYKKEKHEQLVKDMEDPVATANEWLKLVDHPIPPI